MLITRTHPLINRRTLLRGAGATLALPFLEAMQASGRGASATTTPTRLGILFMPNGVRKDAWTPEGAGRDFKLSRILAPLEDCRQDITVLTGLGNRNSIGGDGHYCKTANWLTGTPIQKTTGKNIHCGVSVDQVLAAERGHLTRFPSLELGTEPIMNGVDVNVNYTRLYGSYISWRTANAPLPAEINPRFVFDRLFRGNTTDRRALAEENRSVLDLVMADAKTLQAKLGKEDQQRIADYLDSVRSIEQRIDADIARVASGENLDPAIKAQLAGLDHRIATTMLNQKDSRQLRLDHTEHSRLMLDLMAMAFWTDSTRVSSFMFGWAVSSKNFSFLPGVSANHHDCSHHQNSPDKLDQYEKINRWHVQQFSYFINRLRQMPEAGGSVLDNSLILFGSSLRDGNSHSPHDLPLVLAGRGGGHQPGQHLINAKDTPLCNLYLGLLHRAGMETPSFGDSTTALAGI
jgi:Protein of unknown function (DUF1552)